jgi:trimeric autotransporter adhesin
MKTMLCFGVALGLTSFTLLLRAASANLPAGFNLQQGLVGTPITLGNNMTLNQRSARAIINWSDFSIGAGYSVQFNQPSAASAVLNRVMEANPSLLMGNLRANGQVWLVNQNGIMVGKGAVISTAGLVASTLDIEDGDFMNSSLASMTLSGSSPNRVQVEQGASIRATEGDIFLIAHQVENSGSLQGRNVGLAAGGTVELYRFDPANPGAERLSVVAKVPGAREGGTGVDNTASGAIQAVVSELKAAGGNIYALAINNGGAVRATRLVKEGGRIYLRAENGKVINSGQLDASDRTPGAKGGQVQVLGGKVHLAGGSSVDVSGDAGGGTALVGGDYQGKNPAVPNAQQVDVDSSASIHADALRGGNGGKVIVWSDAATRFSGSISARGGAVAGDGGPAEVSSHGSLKFQGTVDLTSSIGQYGRLLLDPAGDTVVGASDPLDGSSFVDVSSVNSAAAHVTLQANRDLFFNANVTMANPGVGLSGQAGNDVVVNNSLSTRGGSVSLSANDNFNGTATGSGSVRIKAPVDTSLGSSPNGGINLKVGGGTGSIQLGAKLTTGGGAGNVVLDGPALLTAPVTVDAANASVRFNSTVNGMNPAISSLVPDNSLGVPGFRLTWADAYYNFHVQASSSLGGGWGDPSGVSQLTYHSEIVPASSGSFFRLVGSAGQAGADFGLTVSAGGGVTLNGPVGNNIAIGSLDVTGPLALNGGTVTTLHEQAYRGSVTLGNNTTLAALSLAGAGNITFEQTINDSVANTHSLTVNSGGATTFGGGVSGVDGLVTDAAGSTAINSDIATSGDQTYQDPVTLGHDVALTGSKATFDRTVDGTTPNQEGLTVNGSARFNWAIGDGAALKLVHVTGTTEQNGQSVKTGGNQNYDGAVNIMQDLMLSASKVTFGDDVTGLDRNLVVNGGTSLDKNGGDQDVSTGIGNQTYNGVVTLGGTGANKNLVAALVMFADDVIGAGKNLNVDAVAALNKDNAAQALDTGSGNQTYRRAVTLGGTGMNKNLTGAAIRFLETVNSETATAPHSLSVDAGNGIVTFSKSVGAGSDGVANTADDRPLNDLSVVARGGHFIEQASMKINGTARFEVGSGHDLTLDQANDYSVIQIASARDSRVNDINALDLGTSAVSGNLVLTTKGPISDSGNLLVNGTTQLTAGAGDDISLNENNNFVGAVSVASGQNVTLNDINALNLGASAVGGNLDVTTSGPLTGSGDLAIHGTTRLTAGAGNDIALVNNNDFVGALSVVSGDNVALHDRNSLTFGDSTVSGNLAVTAASSIFQNGPLRVSGNAPLTVSSGSIMLGNPGNRFGGQVDFHGGLQQVVIYDGDAFNLSTVTVNNKLSVTSGGDITQSGPMRVGNLELRTDAVAFLADPANAIAQFPLTDTQLQAPTLLVYDSAHNCYYIRPITPLVTKGFASLDDPMRRLFEQSVPQQQLEKRAEIVIVAVEGKADPGGYPVARSGLTKSPEPRRMPQKATDNRRGQ